MVTAWVEQESVEPEEAGLAQSRPDDAWIMLPTFECHLQLVSEPGGSPRYKWGPAGVDFAEALGWARDQAPRVLVSSAGSVYSAGAIEVRDYGGAQLDAAFERNLAACQRYDDIRWKASVDLKLRPDDFALAQPVFAEALTRDELVSDVRPRVNAGGRLLSASFTLCAPFRAIAVARGTAAVRRAATATPLGLGDVTNAPENRISVERAP